MPLNYFSGRRYVKILLVLSGITAVLCMLFPPVEVQTITSVVTGQSPLRGKVIAIDPGHGGDDPGVWDKVRDIKEKDITLAVALQLKELLVQEGAAVVLIRDRDIDYVLPFHLREGKSRKRSDLDQRVEMAARGKADILISLHVNATTKRTYGGAETFYHPQSVSAKPLAENIQKELRSIPGMIKRTPKTGEYYILHHSPMPAVIVELGFLTFPPERERLVNAAYQQQLAGAIARGIAGYFQSLPAVEGQAIIKHRMEHLATGRQADHHGLMVYLNPQANAGALLQGYPLDLDIHASTSRQSLAQSVLENLLMGVQAGRNSFEQLFPAGTRLQSVVVTDGIATVDFNQEIRGIAGSRGEKAAVYAVVGSLLNIPGINGVRLLVEGEPVQTLAGHIDTWHTFHRLTGLYQAGNGTIWEGDRPRAAIVIDDLGAGTSEESMTLYQLQIPITLAVLPHRPYSQKISREATARGYQVILHLPMEPHMGKREWLGPAPILVGLSRDEIKQRFFQALQSVPEAVGFNNHMGSRATEDYQVVSALMEAARERGLFVLDSRTTMGTIIPQVAQEMGVPYAERTIFLDGPDNTGRVERQLHQMAQEAKAHGIAVGIGHVGAESRQTGIILQKAAAIMEKEGVELVFLSEVVK